ncbi:MAG: hypothetical protein HETSPECPRED_010311 [Heterodermia speciosa]|uniref:Ankyrin n=1 Tax=Heterodermia speciosa TaxID=116794 RepID=A0A8H3G7S6_9LECA|nr:MAG: hypothetical protein HETSPECPRED_010311 [Heterodermia speciosa]
MSSSSDTAPTHDHVSPPHRSRNEPEENRIPSLATFAGLCMVKEAYDFFEELQVDLSSIKIWGDDVDMLWYTLDWQRYILTLWVDQIKRGSRMHKRNWVETKESWEAIIQTTVSLNLQYAFPSSTHQGPTYTSDSQVLMFGKLLHGDQYDSALARDDIILMKSMRQATEQDAWNTPFFHERAFTGLIESAVDDLSATHPSVKFQEQRPSSVESFEFKGFIEVLDRQIKALIALSPAEEQEEIYLALDRAFKTALLKSHVGTSTRYLKFYHSIVSAWPFKDDVLAIGIESIFQERVQELFGKMISRSYDPSRPQSFPYTMQDLEDVLALGADVRGEVKGRENCSLWIAANSNNWQFFEGLVYAGAPYTEEPRLHSFPLQAAAEAGNLDIVAFLLNSKQHRFQININHENTYNRTALHEAAENCHESVIKILLQQPGIDANPQDYLKRTPFLLAVGADTKSPKKYASIKNFLRSKIVDFNATAYSPANALHRAARSRDATLKIIIRHVKGINVQDEDEKTPLHYAVECNSKPNVDILLSHGADPTLADEMGFTPLISACSEHHLGPMQLLLRVPESLKHQCPVPTWGFQPHNQPRYSHSSPVTLVLHDYLSCSKGKRAHLRLALRIILAAKPDLEMRNIIGQSVLNYVVDDVDESVLLELLQAGADVDSRDSFGRTPLYRLMRSVSSLAPDSADLLLKWGADMDAKDNDGDAAVTIDLASEPKRLLHVIERHSKEKAKAQQQKNLSVLAKQTEAYVKKQKQREAKRNGPQASSNPFAILPVEETEEVDDE